MRKLATSKKYNKRISRKNKTRKNKLRKNKPRKNTPSGAKNKRRKLRGGMNDLGGIFLEIVKNKKIYKEEGMKHDAQSKEFEAAGWNIEELTQELKTKINDDAKFAEVMELLDEYEHLKNMRDYEVEENDARKNKDNQGLYSAQTDYAILCVKLRDEYGVDVV
jgi:hypothetical protein